MSQETETAYLDTLLEKTKPNSNYVRFNSGDKKTLIFHGDKDHVFETNDERFGPRMRFLCEDATENALNPVPNRIWDVSNRWGRIIISYLKKGKEVLEVERIGTGTGTFYQFTPADLGGE